MIESLNISRFRAFETLELKPLNRINLIAGANNIGKTGILEALYLANTGEIDMSEFEKLFRRTQAQGGERDNNDNFWSWLFHKRDVSKPWVISANNSFPIKGFGHIANGLYSLFVTNNPETPLTYKISDSHGGVEMSLKENPAAKNILALSTRLSQPAEDAELVNAIALRNEEDELIEYLRIIDGRLRKLKYLKLPGHAHAYVYADIGFGPGKDLIPATQLGQGFARMLNLFATLMTKGTQILLIDEFENGLQHDALVPVWEALGKIARQRDIQIFATTHSYECIQAAHQAGEKSGSHDLSVIKLRREQSGEIGAVIMDRDMIATALENEFEIR